MKKIITFGIISCCLVLITICYKYQIEARQVLPLESEVMLSKNYLDDYDYTGDSKYSLFVNNLSGNLVLEVRTGDVLQTLPVKDKNDNNLTIEQYVNTYYKDSPCVYSLKTNELLTYSKYIAEIETYK